MPVVLVPAAIDALIIAIMAALLIWALAPVFRALLQAMAQVPFVGAYVAGRALALSEAAVNNGMAWANAGLSPLTSLVSAVHYRFYFWRDAAGWASLSLLRAVQRVVSAYLPALELRVVEFIYRIWADARSYAESLFNSAVQYAQALFNSAVSQAQALFASAIDYAGRLFAQLEALTQALFTQAIAFAQQVLAQAIAYTLTLTGQAIELAQTLFAQAIGFAEDAFGRSLDFERRLYGDLLGLLERDFVLLRDYARSLFDAQTTYVDVSIAGVLARVLQIERSKCQRFCEPLGDLGNLLQQVEDVALAGLLLAMAAEMARDPHGTAKLIEGLIGPEVRGVIGELGSETGFGRAA